MPRERLQLTNEMLTTWLPAVQRDYLLPSKGLQEVDAARRRMARFDTERNDAVSNIRVQTGARRVQLVHASWHMHPGAEV